MGTRQINEEELNTLYSLIGQGIWHLQRMEDTLHTTIVIKHELKKPGAIPQQEAESLLTKHRRKTLGQSLNFSKDNQVLSPDLQKGLEELKEERDWLVHRCVHQNGNDLYDDEKRLSLFNRLIYFSEWTQKFSKLIAKELEDFVVSHGISREKVMKDAMETIRKLKGEIN